MRAAFNTTCDIYNTAGTIILHANVPCRFVPLDQISYSIWPMALCVGYLTTETFAKGFDVVPMALLAGGNANAFDWNAAQQIAMPTGTAPTHGVITSDHIDARDTNDYWRLYLLVLPFPPTVF